jgi:predicted permease
MLLVGAGLMIQSFSSLVRSDTGLNSEDLLTMHLSLGRASGYGDPLRRMEFFHQVIRGGSEIPGVSSVGAIYPQPLGMSRNAVPYEVEGEPPPPPGEYLMAEYSYVSDGYFRSVGAPLLSGRTFEERDVAEERPVVIVDEAFAERHWPGQNAVGKRIKTAGWQKDVPWLEVVGVVSHIKIFGVAQESWVQMYVPFESVQPGTMVFMVRAEGDQAETASSLRSFVRELDSGVPITSIRPMESYLTDTTAPQRLWALVLGILSGVSLLLAGIGVYGVISYSVSRRDKEIGIRKALGAPVGGILETVLREGLTLVLLGLVLGGGLAYALSDLMESLLFGVASGDPLTYLLGGLILLGVSLVACGLPALRATRLDPVEVLREE